MTGSNLPRTVTTRRPTQDQEEQPLTKRFCAEKPPRVTGTSLLGRGRITIPPTLAFVRSSEGLKLVDKRALVRAGLLPEREVALAGRVEGRRRD